MGTETAPHRLQLINKLYCVFFRIAFLKVNMAKVDIVADTKTGKRRPEMITSFDTFMLLYSW